MSAGSIQTARVNALAILVVGYVGLSFAWAHQQRLSLLWESRLAMAQWIISAPLLDEEERATPTDGTEMASVPAAIRGVGQISYVVSNMKRPPFTEIHRLVVKKQLGGGWAVSFAKATRIGDLGELAAEIGILVVDDDDAVSIYQQVENTLLGAQVAVPGTGLGFQGTSVVWACALVTVGLLLVTRNRLDYALADPADVTGERWLVVDGFRGLERLVASFWVAAFLLVPWLISGALIMATTSQLIADGTNTGLIEDLVMTVILLTVLVLNGWLALTTTERILALREIRREQPT